MRIVTPDRFLFVNPHIVAQADADRPGKANAGPIFGCDQPGSSSDR